MESTIISVIFIEEGLVFFKIFFLKEDKAFDFINYPIFMDFCFADLHNKSYMISISFIENLHLSFFERRDFLEICQPYSLDKISNFSSCRSIFAKLYDLIESNDFLTKNYLNACLCSKYEVYFIKNKLNTLVIYNYLIDTNK